MPEYVGAAHMHTTHSDGTATHADLARIAAEVGLDFLVVTDHNIYVPEAEGWYDDVLLLVDQEIHDTERVPESSHLLVFGADRDLSAYAREPQRLIDAAQEAGGFCFLAHPYERSAAYAGEPDLDWRDWDVTGYAGLEIWNTMSEFKSHVHDLPRALLLAYFPDLGLRGPMPQTLARWDALLANGQRVAAIGGPDAHGTLYRKGPLERPVLPYDWLFRAVRLHILTDTPFQHDLNHDRQQVYDAIRDGRSFIAYDWIGDATGFRFVARTRDGRTAGVGKEIALDTAVELEVLSPLDADLRIVHHGRVVARHRGRTLHHTVTQPGAYRVEAYRRHRLLRRTWVLTNPIYLR